MAVPTVTNTKKLHVLVGVTGSVAAIRLPLLTKLLIEQHNAEVKVVTTAAAQHFFHPNDLHPAVLNLHTDKDEYDTWKAKGDPVLHIELRKWADVMVVAPLDANTLAKIANGLCDNLLTCVVRAWDFTKPIFVAPAMNTAMWEHPLTAPQLKVLTSLGYSIVSPISKVLACGDKGTGAMAEVPEILAALFPSPQ